MLPQKVLLFYNILLKNVKHYFQRIEQTLFLALVLVKPVAGQGKKSRSPTIQLAVLLWG